MEALFIPRGDASRPFAGLRVNLGLLLCPAGPDAVIGIFGTVRRGGHSMSKNVDGYSTDHTKQARPELLG